MSRKKELAKNTVIIFLGKACTQLISFLLLPLYKIKGNNIPNERLVGI